MHWFVVWFMSLYHTVDGQLVTQLPWYRHLSVWQESQLLPDEQVLQVDRHWVHWLLMRLP